MTGGRRRPPAFKGRFRAEFEALAAAGRGLRRLPALICRGLIRFYQICISPLFPPVCRFQPTCSRYALEALRLHGFFQGLYLTARRLLRCHPLNPGGWDPVPPKKGAAQDADLGKPV